MIQFRALQPHEPASPADRKGRAINGLSRPRRRPFRAPSFRTRSGFTLVELLVVIGVITILLAVLMPIFVLTRNRGRDVTCLNNLRQIGSATLIYAEDYDGTLPYAPGNAYAGSVTLSELPRHYDLIRRPSQSSYVRNMLLNSDRSLGEEIFRCPNDTGEKAFNYSQESVYEEAMTSYLWDPASLPKTFPTYPGTPPVVLPDTNPSEPVNGVSLGELNEPVTARLLQDYGSLWHSRYKSPPTQNLSPNVRAKQGFVNSVFADGHVKKIETSNYERFVMNGTGGPAETSPPGTAPLTSPAE